MGNEDLDWLYRRNEPTPEPTRVLPQTPPARRAGRAAAPRPGAATRPQGYPRPHQTRRSAPAAQRQPRARRRGRTIRRTITLLIGAWLIFMIGTPLYAWMRLATTDTTPAADRPPSQPGTLMLLVGSDARDQLTATQRGELGTGDDGGRRTDTMMLLYSPPSGRPALISLPRDSYLPIPGHGKDKLNAAYSFGGAPLLVETVEQATGLRIDGYLEVGFLGIVEIVDALDGIEVCLPSPISDRDSHLDLPAGCQTLDGKDALGYVRMRKADPLGDIGRMNRQRQVIGTIAKKAAQPRYLLNPVNYFKLNVAASRTLTRGNDTGVLELTSAALGFRAVATGQGLTMTVPIANPNASTPAGSSVLWNEADAAEMFSQIASGSTSSLDRFVK